MMKTTFLPLAWPRAWTCTSVRMSLLGVLLSACTSMPSGPTVAVMPAPNKPFDVFYQDDQHCRAWAAQSIGLAGSNPTKVAFMASTITGTAIGTVAGALMGGDRGAAQGAAIGTLGGAAAGSQQSSVSGWDAQRRYDIAYAQCMYAKGNLVPMLVQGGYSNLPPQATSQPPPPAPTPVPKR